MSAQPYQVMPPLSDEEYEALKADIARRGVLVPVELDDRGAILDGHHRVRACQELGVADYPTITRSGLDEAAKREHALKLNVLRRHLGPISWADAFKRLCEARGVTLGQGSRNDRTSATVAEVAAELGTSYRTAARKLQMAEQFEAHPEVSQAVDRGEISPHEGRWRINGAYREALKAKPVPPPVGKYLTLVVDPPWEVSDISRHLRPMQVGWDYPSMSRAELRDFGSVVQSVAAEDCHLFLWTTHKQLPFALELVEHWGFHYECLLTWVKNVGMTPFSFMYTTEHVLFCHRGRARLLKLGERVDFAAPTTGHSVKPDAFFDLVRLVTPGPRLELFARRPHEGFEPWGNEVPGEEAS